MFSRANTIDEDLPTTHAHTCSALTHAQDGETKIVTRGERVVVRGEVGMGGGGHVYIRKVCFYLARGLTLST